MRYVIYIVLFLCVCQCAIGQSNPSGFPTQNSTGWFRHGWDQSDSGTVLAPRLPNFTPRFPGTTILYQNAGTDTSIHYWTGGRWIKISAAGTDTTSLSNRINLKLNISDTIGAWLAQSTRLVDTMYRVNDSTVGYTIKGSPYTFQILGGFSGGGGGSGTVTSVALSMPSAFTVTGSPITGAGTFAVTGAGTSLQYIRGNGTLATFDTTAIPNFYLKVRGLLTGTSPITFSQTTGAIGINNATATGTKGAAAFTGSFSDNGSGLIDLLSLITASSCTNCNLTFDAKGRITAASNGSGGSGSSDTAFNGLTKIADTIQLGGAFTKIDTLDAGLFHLKITGARVGGGVLEVNNTGSDYAATFESAGSNTILATASTGNYVADLLMNSSSTNDVEAILKIRRESTSTPVNGIGGAIDYVTESTAATTTSNRLISIWTDATTGSRTSQFEIWGVNNATTARKSAIAGNGQWTWDGYPALTQQTDTTNIKPIGYNTTTGLIQPMANWMGGGGSVDTVFSTYVAYVDTLGSDVTGAINNPAKPFATINGALIATSSLFICTVSIGMGTFNAPDSANMRSNIWFRGSGMPAANDTVTVNAYYNNTIQAPTKLLGGTIIRGSFIIPFNRENIHCTDFGVDVGSNWVTNFNSGTEVDGFLCAQYFNPAGGQPSADGKHQLQINTKPRRGMLFQNIRVLLASPTSPFHAFLIENTINPEADNIYTTYGFAGVVIKTIGGIYTNIHTRSHGTYHIILKSNDYSFCYGVLVNGFECSTSGLGFTIDQGDPGSPGIYWCNVSNGFINLTGGGMNITGDNMNISNINLVQAGSVLSTGLIRSNVNNITQRLSGGYGFDINTGSVLANGATTWSNCTAIGSTLDGFFVHAGSARNDFESITSGENTSYGFNTNGTAWIGNHNYYSNTAGVTLGTIHNRVEITGLITNGSGISISGDGSEASPYNISASGGSQTWQQTLTTGSTLTGNNTVTGGNNSLTFNGMFNYRINANSFVLDKTTATAPYSFTVLGTDNRFLLAYTPTPATYSKGAGIVIDTNNNTSLGSQIPTAAPLYAVGNSAFFNGFQNQAGNFYRVDAITSNVTAALDDYYFRIDATSGNITITLPAASTAFGSSMGLHYVFKRIDASGNTVTIARSGSDVIDGATSITLTTQYEVKELQCSSASTWDIK